MVANRDSIGKVATPLCKLIIEGNGGSAEAMELAKRLKRLIDRSTTFHKQYDNHEERVLMRHLNLYKNKLAKAKTDRERQHWTTKLNEQRAKITAWKGQDLDLDGL